MHFYYCLLTAGSCQVELERKKTFKVCPVLRFFFYLATHVHVSKSLFTHLWHKTLAYLILFSAREKEIFTRVKAKKNLFLFFFFDYYIDLNENKKWPSCAICPDSLNCFIFFRITFSLCLHARQLIGEIGSLNENLINYEAGRKKKSHTILLQHSEFV